MLERSSMLAWKRENTKRSSERLEQWRDKKSIQIQLVTTYCSNTCLDTKLLAIIRNKEIGQDQECQHTFAHLPLCKLVMTYTPQLYRNRNPPPCHVHHPFTSHNAFTYNMIPRLSFLGPHYIVLHIKMHIFTYESARIHTPYTESLASCSCGLSWDDLGYHHLRILSLF